MENVQNEKKEEVRYIPCIVSGFIFATNEEYEKMEKNIWFGV